MQRLLSRSNIKMLVEKLEARFQSLQTREKRMVLLGGAAVLGFTLYAGFFAPLFEANAGLRETIPTLQKQLAALQAFDHDLKQVGVKEQAEKVSSPVALLTSLQKGLTAAGLFSENTRIKQVSHDAISVHLAQVSFDKMMTWLIAAQKDQAIRIGQFTAHASMAPGTVDADLIVNF